LESAELKTFALTLLPIKLLVDKHQNHRLLGHVSNFVVKFNSTVNDMKADQSEYAKTHDIRPKTVKLFNGFVNVDGQDGLDGVLKLYGLNSSVTMHTKFLCIVTDEFKPYKRETAIDILTRKRVMLISYQT
jgi:hypothetical protein